MKEPVFAFSLQIAVTKLLRIEDWMSITSPYLALLATALCISSCGCTHTVRQLYRDNLVTITERSTVQLLNVHASTDTEVLTIWGHDFENVRGLGSCYLAITNNNLILFVTGKEYDGGQAVIHLAETSTQKISHFPAYDSHIGGNIGAWQTNRFEQVFSLDGNKLVIEAAFLDRHYKYFIDLSTPRFEREEADFFDALSHQLKHHVYENGKIRQHN